MAQTTSYVLGAVLVLLGTVGFFDDPILGIFEVGLVHNSILIVAGLVLLGAAGAGAARLGAKLVGGLVAIVAILGIIPPMDSVAGIADTNLSSTILQALVAVILLAVGFAGGETGNSGQRQPGNQQARANQAGSDTPRSQANRQDAGVQQPQNDQRPQA